MRLLHLRFSYSARMRKTCAPRALHRSVVGVLVANQIARFLVVNQWIMLTVVMPKLLFVI